MNFFQASEYSKSDVEGVMLGLNGDPVHDEMYHGLVDKIFFIHRPQYITNICAVNIILQGLLPFGSVRLSFVISTSPKLLS